MKLEEAKELAIKILKQVMEEKMTIHNIEVATVTPLKGFSLYAPNELQDTVSKILAASVIP